MFTALNRSLAVIEFTPDGHILKANDNFLQTMGYRLAEVSGKHHRMFCSGWASIGNNPHFWGIPGIRTVLFRPVRTAPR